MSKDKLAPENLARKQTSHVKWLESNRLEELHGVPVLRCLNYHVIQAINYVYMKEITPKGD